jgi:hypothetical protein
VARKCRTDTGRKKSCIRCITESVSLGPKKIVNAYIDELSEESRVSQISMSLQEWHERFGHLNEKDLKNIIRKQKVDVKLCKGQADTEAIHKVGISIYRTFRTRTYRRL